MGGENGIIIFPSSFFMLNFLLALLPEKVSTQNVGPVSCYRNNGVKLGIEEVRCAPSLPTSPTYCLKANVYDGRIIRDCASSAQCPQGNACAPITYEEDGTTDFVCCCVDDLCNSSPRASSMNDAIWTLLLALLMLLLIAKYGAHFAL